MRPVTAIAVKDLRLALRGGFFVIVGIVTPLVLAFVMSLVFGGIDDQRPEIAVGVIESDTGAAADRLHETLAFLDQEEVLDLRELDAGADPEQALSDEDLAAVLVVPVGYSAAVASGGAGGSPAGAADAPSLQLTVDPERGTSAGIFEAVVRSISQGQDRQRVAAAAAARLGVDGVPEVDELAVAESTSETGGGSLGVEVGITASMSLLFVFIIALVGSGGVLGERDGGTLPRLLASPFPRRRIVVAKAAVSLMLAVIAVTVLIGASTLLMGAEWGAPLGVALLVLSVAMAASGLTLLISSQARSMESAAGIQSTIAVMLAILSGGMIPLPASGVLDLAAHVSPHYWFLEGLRSLAVDGVWTAALPAVAVLAGFALLLGIPGAALVQRRLAP